MKCVYYSCYPYEADDFSVVDAEEYGCNWFGSAYNMPFRLYKAAVCEGNYTNAICMVKDLFEALDMPQYKGVKDCMKPFKVKYNHFIKVRPTKHYYGATNYMDGGFEINEKYYTISHFENDVKVYNSWEDAFSAIEQEKDYHYLKAADNSK